MPLGSALALSYTAPFASGLTESNRVRPRHKLYLVGRADTSVCVCVCVCVFEASAQGSLLEAAHTEAITNHHRTPFPPNVRPISAPRDLLNKLLREGERERGRERGRERERGRKRGRERESTQEMCLQRGGG